MVKYKGNKFKYSCCSVLAIFIFQVCFFSYGSQIKPFKITAPEITTALPLFESKVLDSYQKIGITAEIIKLPAKRSLATASNSDWVDAELARSEELAVDLDNYIRIPVPILTISINSYGRKLNQCFPTWQSLKLAKVAMLRGFFSIKKRLNEHKVNYFEVESNEQAVAMLKANRVDAIVTPEILMSIELKESLQSSEMHCMEEIEAKPLYHYVRKRHQAIVFELTQALEDNFTDIRKE